MTAPAWTTMFFGPRWDAPRVDDAVQVPTPVDKPCLHCQEPIVDGDQGLMMPCVRGPDAEHPTMWSTMEAVHADCDMLGVLGHMYGVCRCAGFDTTTRAAARELWSRVETERGKPL